MAMGSKSWNSQSYDLGLNPVKGQKEGFFLSLLMPLLGEVMLRAQWESLEHRLPLLGPRALDSWESAGGEQGRIGCGRVGTIAARTPVVLGELEWYCWPSAGAQRLSHCPFPGWAEGWCLPLRAWRWIGLLSFCHLHPAGHKTAMLLSASLLLASLRPELKPEVVRNGWGEQGC